MATKRLMTEAEKQLKRFKELARSKKFELEEPDNVGDYVQINRCEKIGCFTFDKGDLVFVFHNSHDYGKAKRVINKSSNPNDKRIVLSDDDIKSAIYDTPIKKRSRK